VSEAVDRVRDRLRALPLPRWLGAIETKRQLVRAFVLLCLPPLAVTAVFDLNRGILEQGPDPLGALAAHMFLVALCGVAEELVFRYYPRLFLGNGGLVIGTVIWVILHQFYAPVTSVYRLPGDVLHGVFYIKLWRGRYWWLALAIHPLWNIAVSGGWQVAKILNS